MSRRVARRFLERVWSAQPQTEGFVFCSVKDWDDGSWEDYPLSFPLDQLTLPTLEDLYFAPCIFDINRRRKDQALPGRWLYADLDEVDPRSLGIEPTIAWETSPGRYQALWQLARPLRPDQLEVLNQKLTYATGADKGGWSLTKVLRVPGSNSNKRDSQYLVQNLWTEGPVHSASDIYNRIKSTETPRTITAKLPSMKLPKASRSKILRRYRQDLSVTTRRLLEASEATPGTRSERLWKLERLLLEAGMKPEEVLVVVKGTPWNKYAGQRREDEQLWREINQAVVSTGGGKKSSKDPDSQEKKSSQTVKSARAKRGRRSRSTSSSSSTENQRPSPVVLSDFVAKRIRKPMWMVQDIWSESAHGLIAGMPKTYKSVLATDLAISVASGTKFLDRFEVPQVGPVLMIQKENNEGDVQDRVLRILDSRGLGEHAELNGEGIRYRPGADLPIHFINNPDVDIADEDDMEWIAELVRKYKPVLLILDPLYLLAPSVDENSAHQMTPILAALLKIKTAYNCGTLLIHHYHKPPAEEGTSGRKGATRISGTGAFHRWFESAMLLERLDYEEPIIRVSTEHRGQNPTPAFQARIDLGGPDDLHYSVEIEALGKAGRAAKQRRIRDFVESTGSDVRLATVAKMIGMNIEAAQRHVEKEGLTIKKKKIDGKSQRIVIKESN